ncbi:hypothetical protein OHA84_00845 [Streptomyces sp. NBC_00513]|uniref:hypothetical protein n=1 Tax=unclassified Streptomyces TaxID=2593676 RepID=UPI00225692F5|nr:hypothetical protein [Streptomyces sp. NBC_00424]MCX5078727.1 hypothetical protein [Streptomyces sp. NBC_00424]WUD39168.1 hypothetical protein OHA84_00845 [Streptomyces sp. NBC_00513]
MSEKEPVALRPWGPQDGPAPRVWTWPAGDRPPLAIWSCGAWRLAPVKARQDHAGGRTVYQVAIDLDGSTSVVSRLYEWPQPGLWVARRPVLKPSDSGPPVLAGRRRPAIDAA